MQAQIRAQKVAHYEWKNAQSHVVLVELLKSELAVHTIIQWRRNTVLKIA